MAEVILLTGRAGSGKSTAATYLCTHYRFTRMSLATPLREVCTFIYPWIPRDHFYGTKDQKEAQIPDMPPGVTGRRILQHLGTEGVRALNPDSWALLLAARLRALPADARVVVDDVRFLNEARILGEFGPLYRIVRPGLAPPRHSPLWRRVRRFLARMTQRIPWLSKRLELPLAPWEHSSEKFIDTLPVAAEIRNDGSTAEFAATVLDMFRPE